MIDPIVLWTVAAVVSSPEDRGGNVFRDCSRCPEMVIIPAGTFVMDGGVRGAARPVTPAKPFALAVTETTFAQWEACVQDGLCPAIDDDHGWGRGQQPVINVTWAAARGYAVWLSRVSGASYRLPSEAE